MALSSRLSPKCNQHSKCRAKQKGDHSCNISNANSPFNSRHFGFLTPRGCAPSVVILTPFNSHHLCLSKFLSHLATNTAQVSGLGLGVINCLISEALAFSSLHGERSPLHVINAKPSAGVLPEIKLGQIPIKMALIDVLIGANQAALHDAKEAFQRVHMHVAAGPFILGMIDAFVRRDWWVNVVLRLIGNEAAVLVDEATQVLRNAAMIERNRTGIAATLHKAQHNRVWTLAARRSLGLARIGDRGFVGLDNLAGTAQRAARGVGSHCKPNAVAEKPRGFQAAAQGALQLAGRKAFLAGAKQVDGLQPQAQRQVAILENRANPHRERLTAGVALVQASARGLAVQAPDFVARGLAVRADRAVRPKLLFDVIEGRLLVMKPQIGKDRISHGLSPLANPVAA